MSRLENECNITIVGTANNGKQALEMAQQVNPDVVLMDVTMPVMGGLEATRRFQEELPEVHVLILSMHDDQKYIVELMQSGASGYVLKDVSSDELIRAIETVNGGSTYLSAGASQSLLGALGVSGVEGEETKLTKREVTVIKLIAEGKVNKEIARALDISVRTVETHRLNIKNKLKIHSTAGLIKYAIEHELVKLESSK